MISKETGSIVEWTSEENYKFRLSATQPKLIQWLKSNPNGEYDKINQFFYYMISKNFLNFK